MEATRVSAEIYSPSLKLTATAPEDWWLEDDPTSFWGPPFFAGTGAMLVSGRFFFPYFTNLKMAATEIRN